MYILWNKKFFGTKYNHLYNWNFFHFLHRQQLKEIQKINELEEEAKRIDNQMVFFVFFTRYFILPGGIKSHFSYENIINMTPIFALSMFAISFCHTFIFSL